MRNIGFTPPTGSINEHVYVPSLLNRRLYSYVAIFLFVAFSLLLILRCFTCLKLWGGGGQICRPSCSKLGRGRPCPPAPTMYSANNLDEHSNCTLQAQVPQRESITPKGAHKINVVIHESFITIIQM